MVYRMGFAPSRNAARQLVCHRHFLVNGHIVNVPSYQVKPGDVITLREKSRKNPFIADSLKSATGRGRVSYISIDDTKYEGSYVSVPERAEIPTMVQEQLVVELYSK